MNYELRETLVSIENVNLELGNKRILHGVSVSVKNIVRPGVTTGQVVGVLGPSGIGKTQFSRILSGLQAPTSGSVNVAAEGKMLPVKAGLVGVVAQNYPLFRHRTILSNLVVAASQTPGDARQRSLDMLARFGLADKASEYPSQLSGGQRQRVAIAQQLLCSEHFIVMDEPFTGLDPLMKDRTCELISQVASMDERNTIFVVAHDIPAVAAISDTLWLFGRDRDSTGAPIPGSKIQATYDLAATGYAWEPGIQSTAKFASLVAEIRARFTTL